ncbi:hypothetical protein [Tessaracoccus antarcticus]|uniref:Uncharacterized protein n=1 Tax=Tessaracoccus antarcticus TaxID=2479848 RepID=A0A3M0G5X9_9ACTN|nr:hypothetical protein [Tessaracoccus antarcticus]RMB59968.1 hypothetical protein EAX62_09590 [Tessaracoccus antarcticus]
MKEPEPADDAAVTKRARRREQYLSLGLGELAAAAVFGFVASFLVTPRFTDRAATVALWWALTPLIAILVQGGCYWLLAREWVGDSPMPRTTATVYSVLRVVNVALLAAGLAGVLWWWPADNATALLVFAVWFVGVVEYVNYFQKRLSYPMHRWFATVGQWRTPQLVRDLRSARPGHS